MPQTAGFMLGGGDVRSSELLFAWTRAVHVSSVLCCSLLTTLLVRAVIVTAAMAAHMTVHIRASCFASVMRRGHERRCVRRGGGSESCPTVSPRSRLAVARTVGIKLSVLQRRGELLQRRDGLLCFAIDSGWFWFYR